MSLPHVRVVRGVSAALERRDFLYESIMGPALTIAVAAREVTSSGARGKCPIDCRHAGLSTDVPLVIRLRQHDTTDNAHALPG